MAKKKSPTPPPQDAFAARRARLEGLLAAEAPGRQVLAVVFSGEEMGLSVFEPQPDFFYLTGLESPGAALVFHVTPEKRTQILLLPAPDPAAERWTGKILTAGGLTEEAEPDGVRRETMARTGIGMVGASHQLVDALLRPLRAASAFYLPFPADAIRGPIGQAQLFAEDLRRRHPALEIRDLSPRIATLRRVKDSGEVEKVRRAGEITSQALEALLRHLRPGMAEYEAQALVEYAFRAAGAEGLAFPTIVGSGPWSCILHYNTNRRPMEAGDLVVCDIGARWGHYCADITRTFPVSGKFGERQRQVYEVVLEAQEAAIAAVKPGVFTRNVHAAACAVIEKAGFAKYFFHGTSHYLGLEAHDPGSYDLPLEPGCIVTVEPGIYIASESLGVRIEDDVLVTAKGREVLTTAPKGVREIERLMAAPRRKVVL